MTRKPLSKTEDKIWGYILGYIEDNGYPPTRWEIGTKLGIQERTRVQTVQTYLGRMATKGYIKIDPPKATRNIIPITLE